MTAATTVLASEVPMERTRELRPLADAVSVIGTEDMISVGIAAKASAVPIPTSVEPTTTASTESAQKTRPT